MRRPLEVLAVGVVLGELLCLAGIRGILLFLLCLCPALLAFFLRGVRQRILLVLVLGAVAGALRLQLALLPGRAERQLQRAEGAAATFRGRIAEIELRGELTRVRCGSVYLLLRESDGERLALGRVLTASGSLSPIAAPTNPGVRSRRGSDAFEALRWSGSKRSAPNRRPVILPRSYSATSTRSARTSTISTGKTALRICSQSAGCTPVFWGSRSTACSGKSAGFL